MAVNYAEKYAGKLDEIFTLVSKTDAAINKDYEFAGVNAVNVFSIATVELGDYTVNGTARYGTAEELQNTVQTLTMTQDKAFTFVIDKKSLDDSNGAMEAGKALRLEIDERIIPAIDKYRLAKMVAGVDPANTATAAITKANAYETLLDGQNALLEKGVPETDRFAFVSPAFYKAIKLDASFLKASDVGQDMLVRGAMGMVDGVQIIPVPATYLPANVGFVLAHKSAVCSPVKLEDYKTHIDPPGISGALVEGRIRFDAFVMEAKKGGLYVHKTA